MDFIKGMDVSMLRELEEAGASYSKHGVTKDLFELLKEAKVNTIRLRLWHNPYSLDGQAYGGGTNDLASTILLAKRVMKYGLDFALDIHYSDFWTDPKKQMKPKAWKGLHGEALEHAVYHYTYDTLQTLLENGIHTKYVQVGNEITNGFIWPDGHFEHLEEMVRLLKAGIQAVKHFDPDIQTILHLDFGTDNDLYRKWFGEVEPYGLDFDIMGMSYYPYWNGSLEKLLFNMNDMSKLYGKQILIAETAIGYTTDSFGMGSMIYSKELAEAVPYEPTKEGQKKFLQDLVSTIKKVDNHMGIGFIYWEPAWLPIKQCSWAAKAGCEYIDDHGELGNSWGNQALFDQQGEINPALEIFCD